MRDLDTGLAAHIAGRATTLARCWRVERRDGTVLGFTDHDRDIAFDGVTYEAASGLDASEATAESGFRVGGGEVGGGLRSDRITEADLADGLYDSAEVRVFLVNWTAPEERHLLRVGRVGEIAREDGAFRAEIRGLAAQLDQPRGRLYRHGCDADLGDSRCGVDLTGATYRGMGTVVAVADRRRFTASGLGAYAAGWFLRGLLTWTAGANAGRQVEVNRHELAAGVAAIELWQAAGRGIEAGDTFTVTAGCDKLIGTCRAKFANAANFRGFPHMPGNDVALGYARAGDGA